MEQGNYFDYLPPEIFIEILMQTDGVTLGKCRRVSKNWKDVIDDNDKIWHKMCRQEYKYKSRIAKRKAGNDLQWYYIYKNFKMWANVTKQDYSLQHFYKFLQHDKSHAYETDYGLLPLKDAHRIVFYETSSFKLLPIVIADTTCLKIANNDIATVILSRTGIYVQKCLGSSNETEKYFDAQNFVLSEETLYFYCCRDVFKCNLNNETITSELLFSSTYYIKDIKYCSKTLYLFTLCGVILNVTDDNIVTEKLINCPSEWLKRFKSIHSINDTNYVFYSPQLFKVQTDKYHHLYLEFPVITALFFYADDVLIGTNKGEILLFRLSNQKKGPGSRPIFDTLAVLPDNKYAVQLDVFERRNGPVILVSTFFEIILIEYNFFPHEVPPKCNFEEELVTYERLLRINERIKSSMS